ncbi:cytochrome P450 [Halobacteriovorax sp. JY17]|uniref:cytochrome P450 n=1 Tax=Halobacteriovorax sp. JY17 TaxID=2014617 RepID=UPI000C5A090B|nr:cytochrome P450 [Halobacteriovorax sp. JY17]PIK13976.1 MAG: hypothetical protein CES88_13410 [Halobacteriovorax sp. JY17]
MTNINKRTNSKSFFERVDLSHIHGPRGKSFFSYVKKFQRDILDSFLSVQRDYGDYASFPWPMNSVIIYRPELIEELFIKRHSDFIKGDQLLEVSAVIGGGLAVNNDLEDWSKKRSLIAKEFTRPSVKEFTTRIESVVEEYINKLSDESEVDIFNFFKDMSFDISCELFLGVRLENEQVSHFKEALEFCSEVTFNRIFDFIPLPYWVPTYKHKKFSKHYNFLETLIFDLIETKDSEGVLAKLVAAGERGELTKHEIKDELLTLLIAGHETTAFSLGWIFTLLATHGNWKDSDHLNIIHEGLRLYSALPIFSRKASSDTILGDLKIPKNTNVVVPAYVVHRMEEFWKNPNEFNPERFKDVKPHTLKAYFPFGKGPRKCIGEQLGLSIMQIVLDKFLNNYELECLSKEIPKAKIAVALAPSSPVWIKFRRNKKASNGL